MKRFHLMPALLACAALAGPLTAQAAMDSTTRSAFTQECVNAAKQHNLDDKTAKAHCDCGAKQVDSHFSDKEIASLSADASQNPALASKLQKLVAENCSAAKK
ncbi:hypothetical protein [Pseudomonas cichorii]|uniref:hypothetical protein n=1 Tax=Pseudomonas cichorii TaxID=36746 RepID=UPI001C8A8AB3|nr:hypothetical protein [Pseudomonas cichorii]MBX8484160.1 hypothetical protein [Pseudomonas cichorii]MBX8528484.1 hypothetical protein [Pseudomonas cichorii]